MENCIFCKISKKEVPAHIVYEDEKVLVFLDIHPINPGHLLVIPKVHQSDFYRLDTDIYIHLMSIVKKLSLVVERKTNPKKVGLIVAGFDVPHTHLHIVPMHNYHDITSQSILEGKQANPSSEELEKVASELKAFL